MNFFGLCHAEKPFQVMKCSQLVTQSHREAFQPNSYIVLTSHMA
jgi:hypothetical protein